MGRRIALSAAKLAAVGCVLVLVLSLLPWFPFTLLEHFRVQYALAGLVAVASAGALRLRGYFGR